MLPFETSLFYFDSTFRVQDHLWYCMYSNRLQFVSFNIQVTRIRKRCKFLKLKSILIDYKIRIWYIFEQKKLYLLSLSFKITQISYTFFCSFKVLKFSFDSLFNPLLAKWLLSSKREWKITLNFLLFIFFTNKSKRKNKSNFFDNTLSVGIYCRKSITKNVQCISSLNIVPVNKRFSNVF